MNSKGASVIRKMFEEGAVLKKQYGDDNVYDFSIGNPDLEPPEQVIEAIREVAADLCKGRHGYMPNAGYPETRAAMAEKVSGEQGVTVPAECTLMSVGAAGALNCVMKAILSPGDEVIVPAPYFAEYGHYVRNHGGTLVPVPTKPDFSLDTGAIAAALNGKTAAVLINSPNNPSGKIYSAADIAALSAVLNAHARSCGRTPYLLCDEPYRAIVYGNRTVAPVFPAYDAAVVLSSFAKNLSLPGERVGYIAVNPACPDAREFVAACVFATRTLGFVNAPAFFQRVVQRSWNAPADYSSYALRRDQLMAVLKAAGIDFAEPEGAFYLFCKVPPKKAQMAQAACETWRGDDGEFCGHLKNFRVLCAPGSGFGCPGWFRMAYCTSETTIRNSRAALVQAVAEWQR
nr:pyridoxal phosphate-dependent aminotransferase [Treponema brennaborense]